MKSALCALTLLSVLAQVHADKHLDFIRKTYIDTSNITFYDATEQCKNTTQPCITNFKYCDKSPDAHEKIRCPDGFKEDDLSWIKSDKNMTFTFLRKVLDSILVTDSDLEAADMELRWVNTNPKYPTTIVWRDIFSGFYLYQVVEAGKTQWNFNLRDLQYQMLPGWLLPANLSRTWGSQDSSSLDDLFRTTSTASATKFTIGQPDMDDDWRARSNRSDSTSEFQFANAYTAGWSHLAYSIEHLELEPEGHGDKKWKIGVGVGVGVGVPVAAVVGFVVGRLVDKRGVGGKSVN